MTAPVAVRAHHVIVGVHCPSGSKAPPKGGAFRFMKQVIQNIAWRIDVVAMFAAMYN